MKQVNYKVIAMSIGGAFKSKYLLHEDNVWEDKDDILNLINNISKCVAKQEEEVKFQIKTRILNSNMIPNQSTNLLHQ